MLLKRFFSSGVPKVPKCLLFVPGGRRSMLEKALLSKPHAFVPDMEDSVPFDMKTEARKNIAEFLPRFKETGCLVVPRVNGLDSGLTEEDMSSIISKYIWGISVGKVNNKDEAKLLCDMVSSLEKKMGIEAMTIKLVLWLETAQGVLNAKSICGATPRIAAVAFGAEDYSNDCELPEKASTDHAALAFARASVALAANANRIVALDSPYVKWKEEQGLKDEIAHVRALGFKGKFAIHPSQVDPIVAGFAPSSDEIAFANKVVAAYEQAKKEGRASATVDGKMVDIPVYRKSLKVLESI